MDTKIEDSDVFVKPSDPDKENDDQEEKIDLMKAQKEQEALLMKKYGMSGLQPRGPRGGMQSHLQKQMHKGQKFFDSGDYYKAKQAPNKGQPIKAQIVRSGLQNVAAQPSGHVAGTGPVPKAPIKASAAAVLLPPDPTTGGVYACTGNEIPQPEQIPHPTRRTSTASCPVVQRTVPETAHQSSQSPPGQRTSREIPPAVEEDPLVLKPDL